MGFPSCCVRLIKFIRCIMLYHKLKSVRVFLSTAKNSHGVSKKPRLLCKGDKGEWFKYSWSGRKWKGQDAYYRWSIPNYSSCACHLTLELLAVAHAVITKPKDMAARAILSDWLDEHEFKSEATRLRKSIKWPKEPKQKPTISERRAMKATTDLARWQRKLKFAQTKVRKLKIKVNYYLNKNTS